jgi:hypothetical protein
MPRAPRAHSKTYKVPRRPYESARLDAELKVGFGRGGVLCRHFGIRGTSKKEEEIKTRQSGMMGWRGWKVRLW